MEITAIDSTMITVPIRSSHNHIMCRANIRNTAEHRPCHGDFFVHNPLRTRQHGPGHCDCPRESAQQAARNRARDGVPSAVCRLGADASSLLAESYAPRLPRGTWRANPRWMESGL
jgi:hypothetical protein